MKKQNILFVIMLMLSFSLNSQIIITGKVIDQETQSPLPWANIKIDGTYLGTVSGNDGNFTLNVKSLPVTLIISYMGYETDTVVVKEQQKNLIALKRKSILTDEIVVSAIRQEDKSPKTYTNVTIEKIQSLKAGQDLPLILNFTPSVVATSDAGNGIGYTDIRIRGTDITRINVTINGVPYNDPESQGVFWVDIPDIASSSDNIQIQRGVGTSSFGAASFGASINILTGVLKADPFVELQALGGSFNTFGASAKFGTGLIKDNWYLEGRLSHQYSDGYIDRAFSELNSAYLSGGYYGKNTIIKGLFMAGYEKTYQAWGGVPKEYLNDAKLRRYNPYTYENETDNYWQYHYHLNITQKLNEKNTFNATLFYINGYGFYEQYKKDKKLSNYNLEPVILIDTTRNDTITIKSMDLVQRKFLENDFYGIIMSHIYNNNKNLRIRTGLNYYEYDGWHYGRIIWMQYAHNVPINHEWYKNRSLKNEFSIFTKFDYDINEFLTLYADIQYRYVDFTIKGTDDAFISDTLRKFYNFWNPKLGLNYNISQNDELYLLTGISHREPNRDNLMLTDVDSLRPVHETLYDLELGYTRKFKNGLININAFYMYYDNQLVLTGKINDVGDPIMQNVPESYRTGVELIWNFDFTKWLSWDANFTFSENKIKKITMYIDDYELWPSQRSLVLKNTPISFSPSIVASSILTFKPLPALSISLLSKYVSKQYIDNTGDESCTIDPFMVHNIRIDYTIKGKKFDKINLFVTFNNIFNEFYETNAWVYRYYDGGVEYKEFGYFPQATFNVIGGLTFRW
ncbi:MAG: TonB-dependent receptor [Bacteroidales bacterium]|nr:TonB-dependent receptor [Bacteroidales bacterium]